MIAAGVDCKDSTLGFAVFSLNGKRFIGFEAQRYLREECGFSDTEAVQYLVLLSASEACSVA